MFFVPHTLRSGLTTPPSSRGIIARLPEPSEKYEVNHKIRQEGLTPRRYHELFHESYRIISQYLYTVVPLVEITSNLGVCIDVWPRYNLFLDNGGKGRNVHKSS